jgi:hypothetical protein
VSDVTKPLPIEIEGTGEFRDALTAAENVAAAKAMRVFLETLVEELRKVPGTTSVMAALGNTTHVHYALVDGDAKGVVRCTFEMDGSPEAVRTVIAAKAKRGIG